jgi:hypothetical protein
MSCQTSPEVARYQPYREVEVIAVAWATMLLYSRWRFGAIPNVSSERDRVISARQLVPDVFRMQSLPARAESP